MFTRQYAVWPEHLPKHLTVPETSLFTNLEISARRYPDKAAIIYYGTVITYTELLREVEALAGYLQQQGVGKGDRVLLYMQNAQVFAEPGGDQRQALGTAIRCHRHFRTAYRRGVRPAGLQRGGRLPDHGIHQYAVGDPAG